MGHQHRNNHSGFFRCQKEIPRAKHNRLARVPCVPNRSDRGYGNPPRGRRERRPHAAIRFGCAPTHPSPLFDALLHEHRRRSRPLPRSPHQQLADRDRRPHRLRTRLAQGPRLLHHSAPRLRTMRPAPVRAGPPPRPQPAQQPAIEPRSVLCAVPPRGDGTLERRAAQARRREDLGDDPWLWAPVPGEKARRPHATASRGRTSLACSAQTPSCVLDPQATAWGETVSHVHLAVRGPCSWPWTASERLDARPRHERHADPAPVLCLASTRPDRSRSARTRILGGGSISSSPRVPVTASRAYCPSLPPGA